MKNQDKVPSHTRLSEAEGGSKCPPAIFPSRFDRTEQKTLDTEVRPGGGQGCHRTRVHPSVTPPGSGRLKRARTCTRVCTSISTHPPARTAVLWQCPAKPLQSGSCPGAPPACRTSKRRSQLELTPMPAATQKRAILAPGTSLTCSSLGVCTSSLIISTRKATLTGFDPFGSFCFSCCGNAYL